MNQVDEAFRRKTIRNALWQMHFLKNQSIIRNCAFIGKWQINGNLNTYNKSQVQDDSIKMAWISSIALIPIKCIWLRCNVLLLIFFVCVFTVKLLHKLLYFRWHRNESSLSIVSPNAFQNGPWNLIKTIWNESERISVTQTIQ